MKVYLCGPITGLGNEDCKQWRDEITLLLHQGGHQVLDPMRRDYRGIKHDRGIARSVIDSDLSDLNASDIMIRLYSDQGSEGSAQETFYFAHVLKRKVILVRPNDVLMWNVSPWLWFHTHYYVPTIQDAVEMVNYLQRNPS